MAQIIGSTKKIGFLFFCGLLLLTANVISGSISAKSEIVENVEEPKELKVNNLNVSTIQEMAKNLVNPIPNIMFKFVRLTSASRQQLDTALILPKESQKETNITTESYTPSPLIEYPKSFQTTVLQIVQQFSKALRAVNSKSNEMAMELLSVPDYIDTLVRYMNPPVQKSNILGKLLPLPLNGLKKISEKIVLLSRESCSEFQGVANLTKAFADIAKLVLSTKIEYLNTTSEGSLKEELTTKLNYKKELDKNITYLEEQERGISNGNYSLEIERELEIGLSDSEMQNKQENSNYDESRTNNMHNHKNENEEESPNLEETAIKKEAKIFHEMIEKMDEDNNLVFDITKLRHEIEKLNRDISLLVNTTKMIDKLGQDMNELAFGWESLANYCRDIQSDITIVRSALLPNKTVYGRSESQKNKSKEDLQKIRDDMKLISKFAKFFVEAYDSNLSSLAAQLDQIMTTSNKDSEQQRRKLIVNSNRKTDKLKEMLMKEFPSS